MSIRYKFDCVTCSFEGVVSAGSIGRSIDRSEPSFHRSIVPSIASPKRRRNHRHLLSVLSRQDNLLPRSNIARQLSLVRPPVDRGSRQRELASHETPFGIFIPRGGYPRIVSVNRGEVGAAWQLADRIERNVSPTDVREKRTGCLYICPDDFRWCAIQ